MFFYALEPEVAGELGEGTVLDTTFHPPRIDRLHYNFQDWLGDGLLESFPCFIVTEPVAIALSAAEFTGFSLSSCVVTTSQEFDDLYPDGELPRFQWLRPTGVAGVDDIALTDDHRLLVSAAAKSVLDSFQLRNCAVEVWSP